MANADSFSISAEQSVGETARASLELLFEISREFASALDLRTVLHRVLFLSMKNVGAISGSIIVLDDAGQPTESAFLIVGQAHDTTTLQLRVTYERGLAGWVARNREAVLVPDTSHDERWLRRPDDATEKTGPKSALSVPILAQEKLVGVITLVHPKPGFFSLSHLELVKAIADQAGIAIRNAQLFEGMQVAHQRYRELFQDSIDPILITDWQGGILEANRQAENTIGLGGEELNDLLIDSLHSVDREKVGENFEKLVSGETISYESVLRTQSGRSIPIQVYVRSILYKDAQHLQWILRDISERKYLDSLREDLIAMVYHDLRSPLSNVVSSLEVMETTLSEQADSTTKSLINIALRSTERIQRLTNSLLDINRLEAGQAIGNRRPAFLHSIMKDALEAVLPIASGKEQAILVDVSIELPEILVDEDMIRRVLINLLENAIKFTPPKGKIYVGAQRDVEFVEIWVQDTGPGISSSDQERIFDKFTRLGAGESLRGLGLGLAYCKLTIEGHGGHIWIESEPGSGACFRFILPVAGAPAMGSGL